MPWDRGPTDISQLSDLIIGLTDHDILQWDAATAQWVAQGYLELGPSPASTGDIRMSNSYVMYWRNAANTGDIPVLDVDGSDILHLGFGGHLESRYDAGDRHRFETAAGIVAQIESSYLELGPNISTPSSVGILRVPNAEIIGWRNNADTADIRGWVVDTSDFMTTYSQRIQFHSTVTSPVIRQEESTVAGAAGPAFTIHAQDMVGGGATVGATLFLRGGNGATVGPTIIGNPAGGNIATFDGTYMGIGANFAASGALRLANNANFRARNNANTADVQMLVVDASDHVVVGGVAAVNVDIGIAGAGADVASFGDTYLALGEGSVGSPPAASGILRLPNNEGMYGRNAANTNDIGVIVSDGADRVLIGDTTVATEVRIRANGATLARIGAAASDLLVLGANASTTGTLRLGNNGAIRWRNAANTGNVDGVNVNASDQVTVGGTNATQVLIRPDGATVAIFDTTFMSLGTNPATTGIIRLPNGTGDIYWRNAANTANLLGMRVNASDTLIMGGSSGVNVFIDLLTSGAGNGNLAIGAQPANWQAMQEGIFIGNATAVPTGNPAAGGFLYSTGGAGTWRGSGGTITTFGPAEPECPVCGTDAALDYYNENGKKTGNDDDSWETAICLNCLLDELEKVGVNLDKIVLRRKLKGKKRIKRIHSHLD